MTRKFFSKTSMLAESQSSMKAQGEKTKWEALVDGHDIRFSAQ